MPILRGSTRADELKSFIILNMEEFDHGVTRSDKISRIPVVYGVSRYEESSK